MPAGKESALERLGRRNTYTHVTLLQQQKSPEQKQSRTFPQPSRTAGFPGGAVCGPQAEHSAVGTRLNRSRALTAAPAAAGPRCHTPPPARPAERSLAALGRHGGTFRSSISERAPTERRREGQSGGRARASPRRRRRRRRRALTSAAQCAGGSGRRHAAYVRRSRGRVRRRPGPPPALGRRERCVRAAGGIRPAGAALRPGPLWCAPVRSARPRLPVPRGAAGCPSVRPHPALLTSASGSGDCSFRSGTELPKAGLGPA